MTFVALMVCRGACFYMKHVAPTLINLKDVTGKFSQLFTFKMPLWCRASKLCSCFVLLCLLQLLKVNLEKKISGLVSDNYCTFFSDRAWVGVRKNGDEWAEGARMRWFGGKNSSGGTDRECVTLWTASTAEKISLLTYFITESRSV